MDEPLCCQAHARPELSAVINLQQVWENRRGNLLAVMNPSLLGQAGFLVCFKVDFKNNKIIYKRVEKNN
jgi:hypothetical protein